ncbi:hypothetical protein IAR50_002972 [Cryptococcus sp. DSM 104548]
MSLNTVQLGPSDSPLLFPGEELLTPGNTATITLSIPPTRQGPKRTDNAQGRFWVTDHRVIFIANSLNTPGSSAAAAAASIAPPEYDAPPALNSLEIGYTFLRSCTYNLPTFSANHLLINFLPSPLSSLPDPGRGQGLELKVIVGEGAGHGVWKRIEGERSRAEERGREGENEDLPAYEPASGSFGAPPAS